MNDFSDKFLTKDLFERYTSNLKKALEFGLDTFGHINKVNIDNKRLHATILCCTHHLNILPDGLLKSIVRMIGEAKVLKNDDVDVSVAAINLLIKCADKVEEQEYWKEILKKDGGIYTQLVVKKLQMESMSNAIDKFYEALDKKMV